MGEIMLLKDNWEENGICLSQKMLIVKKHKCRKCFNKRECEETVKYCCWCKNVIQVGKFSVTRKSDIFGMWLRICIE